MILKTDCKLFPGDRPCIPNKAHGIMCDNCNYYDPVTFRILIIKLDAIGDVLRTTSLLHALKKQYPSSHITWLTKHSARDIFKNNPIVDEVLTYEDPSLRFKLAAEKFNLLVHPDASPVSSAIASSVNAEIKKGYILNELGKVIPVNDDAVEWLEMGAFDQLKKNNTKTYQQIIHEIAGLKYEKGEIIIALTEKEKNFRDEFRAKFLTGFDIVIGLNTGSSKRWQLKQWRFEGYKELIYKLDSVNGLKIGIVLYGGPEEIEKNKILKDLFPNVIDSGTDNTLREFFALMDIPDIVLTGDTLALHAATALKKNVICLFGPTSSAEIEDYGRIKKITPDMTCLVCYKQECDFAPNCMELISSDMVFEVIIEIVETITGLE